jgi:quercetin dioxygenase-like cupin family protein
MSPVDRASLEARLRAEGLDPSVWSSGPGALLGRHTHDFDKVLVVVDGKVTFGLTGSGAGVTLASGERLDLPADVEHEASVGDMGVTCFEAHPPAGSLGSLAKARGQNW